jgi:hypothetical protein
MIAGTLLSACRLARLEAVEVLREL